MHIISVVVSKVKIKTNLKYGIRQSLSV